ncbi:adaptor protein complex AP-2, alpha subunit [Actinidia rufa]|uniref:Adaptor protein complex AP-2, alpha subunit n=1 Tax=Actinidia rufa TaxID=165716 RepID=A0A7J0HBF5_9ERIC|nr:adaptor protein complex AP-2, alpha subunit [Actinidia rufa]
MNSGCTTSPFNLGLRTCGCLTRLLHSKDGIRLGEGLEGCWGCGEGLEGVWRFGEGLGGVGLKYFETIPNRVRGVRPMSLAEMANLFNSFRLIVCPGLDPNANNLVASTTFYSESTRAMLCLIRIETDPADRTQLRMTVASGEPTLTFELKEFIKEQLVSIPTVSRGPAPPLPQTQPTSAPAALSDPGAMLAGLLH